MLSTSSLAAMFWKHRQGAQELWPISTKAQANNVASRSFVREAALYNRGYQQSHAQFRALRTKARRRGEPENYLRNSVNSNSVNWLKFCNSSTESAHGPPRRRAREYRWVSPRHIAAWLDRAVQGKVWFPPNSLAFLYSAGLCSRHCKGCTIATCGKRIHRSSRLLRQFPPLTTCSIFNKKSAGWWTTISSDPFNVLRQTFE